MEINGRQTRRGFDVSRPVKSFVQVVRGVLIEPARFFAGLRESREGQRNTWGPFIFAVVCAAVGVFLTFLAEPLDPRAPGENASDGLYGFSSQEALSDYPWAIAVGIVYALATVPVVLVLGLYL